MSRDTPRLLALASSALFEMFDIAEILSTSGYLLQVYRQEIIAYRFGYAKHVPLMWTTCIEGDKSHRR